MHASHVDSAALLPTLPPPCCHPVIVDVYKVRCRRSCGSCASLDTVLRLAYVSGSSPDPALAAATSFRMAEPLVPTYPPGSKVGVGGLGLTHVWGLELTGPR